MVPSLRIYATVVDQRDAVHAPPAREVVERDVVLRAAVVPDRDGARGPAEAHLELRLREVVEERTWGTLRASAREQT